MSLRADSEGTRKRMARVLTRAVRPVADVQTLRGNIPPHSVSLKRDACLRNGPPHPPPPSCMMPQLLENILYCDLQNSECFNLLSQVDVFPALLLIILTKYHTLSPDGNTHLL